MFTKGALLSTKILDSAAVARYVLVKMSSGTAAEITAQVHAANAQAHDVYAFTHDRTVPYIRRRRTRRYYESLIRDGLARGGQEMTGRAVLELGCGTGTFARFALESGAGSFTGVDLSEGMLEVARRKFTNPCVRFVRSSLEDFAPGARGKYEIIVSSSFLHHLVDLRAGLDAIGSMLQPGGVYVAIHELVTGRSSKPWIEKVDEALQTLFGYGAGTNLTLAARLQKTLHYAATVAGRKLRIAKTPRPQAAKTEAVDYVDYQLNHGFSLSRQAGSFGEVIPYCYLCFIELRHISAPLNHEMLVMRRGES